MTLHESSFQILAKPLEESFECLNLIAGTFTAQAYWGIEKATQAEVIIWRTRGPIAVYDIERFRSRLINICGVRGIPPLMQSGIDVNRFGFAVMRDGGFRPITEGARDQEELNRRFEECLGVLESLHDQSILCGDLCMDSFVVSESGGVSLFAVLGDVAIGEEECEFDRSEYLAFRPPEQRPGEAVKPGFDLYALGWIGEGLFACEVAENSDKPRIPPKWLKNILRASGTEELRTKVSNVRIIRSVITEHAHDTAAIDSSQFGLIEISEVERQKTENRRKLEKMEAETTEQAIPSPSEERGSKGDNETDPIEADRNQKTRTGTTTDTLAGIRNPSRVLALAIANVVAFGVLCLSYYDSRYPDSRDPTGGNSPSVRYAIELERIRSLYASDSSGAHEELMKLFTAATSAEERDRIVRALVFRARRLGLSRSADVALGFYVSGSDRGQFGAAGASALIVNILNTGRGQNERVDDLVKLYEIEPRLAAVLATAFALDSGDVEPFRGILSKAASDQVGVRNGGEHSPYALMLLLPDAHDRFSEDVIAVQEKIPSADIVWLLQELGRAGQVEVSTVAQLAYNRKVVSEVHSIFLKELQRGISLNQALRSSLVAGALGTLSEADIKRFGDWYGKGAPRVLEAGILTVSDPELGEAAFSSLSSKPIQDPYVASVLEFMRGAYENNSSRFSELVAVLALRDVIDPGKMTRSLKMIETAPRKRELLKRLIQGAPPELLVEIVGQYGNSMDTLDIVDLL